MLITISCFFGGAFSVFSELLPVRVSPFLTGVGNGWYGGVIQRQSFS